MMSTMDTYHELNDDLTQDVVNDARADGWTKPARVTSQPPPADVESTRAGWRAQVRAYTQSIRAYQLVMRRQIERDRRRAGSEGLTPVHPVFAPSERQDQATADEPVSANHAAPELPPGRLTRRQREVATLIAEGLTNVQIAQRLVLTPGTVGNHVEHILRRLGMSNRAQVAVWVARQTDAPADEHKLAFAARSIHRP